MSAIISILYISIYSHEPISHIVYIKDKSEKYKLALLPSNSCESILQYAKTRVKKENIIRLFQVIRHQGSEQVSKPDIHHVDFLFLTLAVDGKKSKLTIKVWRGKSCISLVGGRVSR